MWAKCISCKVSQIFIQLSVYATKYCLLILLSRVSPGRVRACKLSSVCYSIATANLIIMGFSVISYPSVLLCSNSCIIFWVASFGIIAGRYSFLSLMLEHLDSWDLWLGLQRKGFQEVWLLVTWCGSLVRCGTIMRLILNSRI